MLHQQMRRADLSPAAAAVCRLLARSGASRRRSSRGWWKGGRGVVRGHVGFEQGGVGAGGGFPAGFLVGRVEVVGQVFGVGVAHFPGGGESGGHGGLNM